MSKPNQPITVGILLIATNKYKHFVQPLIYDLGKNFFKGHVVTIFLFTDDLNEGYFHDGNFGLKYFKIPSYKFPEVTLYRYKTFLSHGIDIYKDCTHLFYLDVDMGIVAPVGEEILGDIVAVRHPGFFNGGGSWGNDPASLSYTDPDKRKHYYAGGFQGGSHDHFLAVADQLRARIQTDEENGIMAEWHDETHWNWYLANNPGFKELTPEYCMVEQQHLREQWGIAHFQPKIIALAKNHDELRK